MASRTSTALAAASDTRLDAPRKLTPTFALSFLATLAILLAVSAGWFVGLLVAIGSFLSAGMILPLVIVGFMGVLLGRGWYAMVHSVRVRLRSPDLSETGALPDAFGMLSPALQRLVLHTRTVAASFGDEEIDKPAVLRELYDWVTAVAEAEREDRDALAQRGISSAMLRAQIVALHGSADARVGGLDLLARFELALLDVNADPFRGLKGSRSRD